MKNGYFHELGLFAPETAIGTGAKEPLVDEVEAAEATPSVDATTAGQGKNKPRANESHDLKPSGEKVAEPTSNALSTGEESEVRDNPNAHKADADVNKEAHTVRPEVPQAVKKTSRNAKATTTPAPTA